VSFAWRRDRHRFTAGRHTITVVSSVEFRSLASELAIDDVPFAWDRTPTLGSEAARLHRLAATLPDGRRLEVEAGPVAPRSIGIVARLDGELIHESHPGQAIAPPVTADAQPPEGYDPGQLARNKVPLMVDIALGLLFFAVAKLTDLSTAALVAAGAGIALVVLQRFVGADLLGGLALFGVVMLLISAGLALAFHDDTAVKMRSTIVGAISAVLFLGDGLLGGNRLGKGLTRYLPYTDVDPGRLALGMGVLGLVMAGLNYAVARLASTDVWLFYTTFVDFFLLMLLILVVFSFARGRLFPPRRQAGDR
jgi:intracellular septation protein A